jgi:hypothetical protein
MRSCKASRTGRGKAPKEPWFRFVLEGSKSQCAWRMGCPKVTRGEVSLLLMAVGFQGAVIVNLIAYLVVDKVESIRRRPEYIARYRMLSSLVSGFPLQPLQ